MTVPNDIPPNTGTGPAKNGRGGTSFITCTEVEPAPSAKPVSPTRSPDAPKRAAEPALPRAPKPTRPKGQWFAGLLLCVIFGVGGYSLWNAFFRYSAFGEVTARVLEISSPSGGLVSAVHVREGDEVRPGQTLITVRNVLLENRLAQLQDEQRLLHAQLAAHAAQLALESQASADRQQKALSEYYELWGELAQGEAAGHDLEDKLQRRAGFQAQGVVSQEDVQSLERQLAGRRLEIDNLRLAVAELEKRGALAGPDLASFRARMQPQHVQLAGLAAEIDRLRTQLNQSSVQATSGGRVLRVHRFAGEYAAAEQPLVELLENNSVAAVLYLPQAQANVLSPGDEVAAVVAPRRAATNFRVERLDYRLTKPPLQLERYFTKNAQLVAVYLQPCHDGEAESTLRVGSEIKVPVRWREWAKLGIGGMWKRDRFAAKATFSAGEQQTLP